MHIVGHPFQLAQSGYERIEMSITSQHVLILQSTFDSIETALAIHIGSSHLISIKFPRPLAKYTSWSAIQPYDA